MNHIPRFTCVPNPPPHCRGRLCVSLSCPLGQTASPYPSELESAALVHGSTTAPHVSNHTETTPSPHLLPIQSVPANGNRFTHRIGVHTCVFSRTAPEIRSFPPADLVILVPCRTGETLRELSKSDMMRWIRVPGHEHGHIHQAHIDFQAEPSTQTVSLEFVRRIAHCSP